MIFIQFIIISIFTNNFKTCFLSANSGKPDIGGEKSSVDSGTIAGIVFGVIVVLVVVLGGGVIVLAIYKYQYRKKQRNIKGMYVRIIIMLIITHLIAKLIINFVSGSITC